MKPSLKRSPTLLALLLVALFAAPSSVRADETDGTECITVSYYGGLYTKTWCADGCQETTFFWQEGYCDPLPAEA